ncbi:MAG TPA: hypothetical protein VFT44_14850, partial [Pyrinomonadaceae bacterium]|nr:hypothetical protein [Pyrinomonadaceae bacterium]
DPRMILGLLVAKPLSTTLLRQNFKSAAMLWTDQLEVATVKCENARDARLATKSAAASLLMSRANR